MFSGQQQRRPECLSPLHHGCFLLPCTLSGGFKLHFELSYLLGSAAEAVLQLSAALYTALWPLLGPALLLVIGAMSAVGGAVTGLAAAADVVMLMLLPVEVVYGCAAGLYRLQLMCLRATWRLLRGKQKVGGIRNSRCQGIIYTFQMHATYSMCAWAFAHLSVTSRYLAGSFRHVL